MKVLHIFNEIKFSGAEVMYRDAAKQFQNSGVEIHALSSGVRRGDFSSNFENEGIIVAHKSYTDSFVLSKTGISFYKFLFKYIKNNKIDVLHIHRSSVYFAAVIGTVLGIPTLKTQHNVFINRKSTRFIAIIRRALTRVFFNTIYHTIGQSVHDNELNQFKNPSTRINNWYNHKKFFTATTDEKKEVRQQLNLLENSFVVISVGGCSTVKNHHDIIKALSILKTKIDITYLHLGKGKTEEDEIELAKELGVYDRCVFVGNTDKVREYLIASDVYLMPSKFEGLSISCLETMGCGIPVVLYNVMGLKDMIDFKTQDNGFLIEASHKELAKKILEYYNSEELRNKKAKNALKNVKKNFFIEKNVDEMISLYRKILA